MKEFENNIINILMNKTKRILNDIYAKTIKKFTKKF